MSLKCHNYNFQLNYFCVRSGLLVSHDGRFGKFHQVFKFFKALKSTVVQSVICRNFIASLCFITFCFHHLLTSLRSTQNDEDKKKKKTVNFGNIFHFLFLLLFHYKYKIVASNHLHLCFVLNFLFDPGASCI